MKKLLLPFFLLGTLAMMFVMAKTGSTLKTPATPMGILDLEFAYNISKTTAVLHAWTPTATTDNITAAKNNTYWDFLFLFFYAGFLFLASKKIAVNNTGAVGKAGNVIAKAAILAGFLDVVENIGMLLSLHGHTSSTVALCTTVFAITKWALAVIAVLYVLTGLLLWTYKKIKS